MPHSSRFTPVEPATGSAEMLARIDKLIADLRPKQADLLTAFHRIQHEYGHVPPEAVPLLASRFANHPRHDIRRYGLLLGGAHHAARTDHRRVVQRPRLPPEGIAENPPRPGGDPWAATWIRRRRTEHSACGWCSATAPATWHPFYASMAAISAPSASARRSAGPES